MDEKPRALMYAIISINTTGSELRRNKIIELAILISDGDQIVDSYNTLLNPERKIPFSCTRKCGIDDAMVAQSQKFYEIAGIVLDMLKGKILVGHHIKHSYQFLQNEFQQLGFDFASETHCTSRLARRILKDLPSYSLDNLLQHFGYEKPGSIKAYNKALSISLLFHKLSPHVEKALAEPIKSNAQNFNLDIEKIPKEAGIYYFYDKNDTVIYVGKSKNLRSRVQSHLRNIKTYKGISIISAIYKVEYELTGNDIMALLFEDKEIKRLMPRYNTASKRRKFPYGLFLDNSGDYHKINIKKLKNGEEESIIEFRSKNSAESYLRNVTETYALCDQINDLEAYKKGACFKYRIELCKGACIAAEPEVEYNTRVAQFIDERALNQDNYMLTSKGRTEAEYSFILVTHGRISGFGFVPISEWTEDLDRLKDYSETIVYDNDLHRLLKLAKADLDWMLLVVGSVK